MISQYRKDAGMQNGQDFVEELYLEEGNARGLPSGVYRTFKAKPLERIRDLPETKFKKGDTVRVVNSKIMLMAKEGDLLKVEEVFYAKEEKRHAREKNLPLYYLSVEGKAWLQWARESDLELAS